MEGIFVMACVALPASTSSMVSFSATGVSSTSTRLSLSTSEDSRDSFADSFLTRGSFGMNRFLDIVVGFIEDNFGCFRESGVGGEVGVGESADVIKDDEGDDGWL